MSLAASMLADDALRAGDDGFELDVHLNWYRSLPLSSLKTVQVTVNGEAIDRDEITWVVNGAEHRLDDLGEHWDEIWFVLDPATIRVPRPLVKDRRRGGGHGPPRQPDPVHPDRPGPGARVRDREVEDAGGPMSGFKLSTTLFALTNEWLSREYTFESLVDKTVELGLGPGLEIVGFQSVRGYPRVDPEFEKSFKALMERHELEPSCLSANIDLARRPDRLMTQDEVKETLAAQVEFGRRLGFPVVKAQKLEDDLYPWAADLAEKAGVKLGIEIHAPVFVEHPLVVGLREVYDRIDSPALGFVPDWSSTMTALPTGQLRAFERNGLTREQTDFLRELWDRGGAPHDLFEEFAEKARSEGATEQAVNQVRIVFSMFAHNDPRGWLELMPRVIHVHAKFYELEADGTDPSIPHRELFDVLVEGGYEGYVSSEWEAHAWADREDQDGFEMVRRHQQLYRTLLAEHAAGTPA